MRLKISIQDTENCVNWEGTEIEPGDLLRWEDDGGQNEMIQLPALLPARLARADRADQCNIRFGVRPLKEIAANL